MAQRKRAFKKQPHPSQEAVGKRPTHPLAIVEPKAVSKAYKENWNLIFGTKKKR
jgi:hypothetical protein